MNLPEGFRRTSLVLGWAGLLAWIAFAAAVTGGFQRLRAADWVAFGVTCVLAFVAPWAITRGIGWAVQGFRARDRAR